MDGEKPAWIRRQDLPIFDLIPDERHDLHSLSGQERDALKSLLSRLFKPVEPSGIHALWHRIVAIAREPEWYRDAGVADTIEGRFDMVSAVTALALMRLQDSDDPRHGVELTEMFITDMDGQLREEGVGDLMVGKHMGRLVAALGGRITAYREGLESGDDAVLRDAVRRNVTLLDGADPAPVANRMRALWADLIATPMERVLEGNVER